MIQQFRIVVEEKARRAGEILSDRLQTHSHARPTDDPNAYTFSLSLDPAITRQGYRITHRQNGLSIAGDGLGGLMAGVGRFLHTAVYGADGFEPDGFEGVSLPECSHRSVYFASHFFNYYHVAPIDELQRYIEDLALWGYNVLQTTFPRLNLWGPDDPNVDAALRQLKGLHDAARGAGMMFSCGGCGNSDFKNFNKDFVAAPNYDPLHEKGDNGHNICVSKPGAMEYILGMMKWMFGKMKEYGITTDFVNFFPYDEGGCGCPDCHPWGANGYLRMIRAAEPILRELNPQAKIVIGTWMFDTPYMGEWPALYEMLEEEPALADYVMAGAHEEFPAYPLKHRPPHNIPLIDFPEISMWGLFPWGGFGANPLPKRLTRLWQRCADAIDGGRLYSEGPYEDINKVIYALFFWDRERDAEKAMRLYANYELTAACADDFVRLCELIEQSHTEYYNGYKHEGKTICDIDISVVDEAKRLADSINDRLPKDKKTAWRWRLMYLRALIDYERYHMMQGKEILFRPVNWGKEVDFRTMLHDNEKLQGYFRELVVFYRNKEKHDPVFEEHAWIRPPID